MGRSQALRPLFAPHNQSELGHTVGLLPLSERNDRKDKNANWQFRTLHSNCYMKLTSQPSNGFLKDLVCRERIRQGSMVASFSTKRFGNCLQ